MNTGPSDSEPMEAKEGGVEIEPTGAVLPGNFWHAMSFEELAAAQGVGPLADIDQIIGTWPGDVNDGFEEAALKLRRPRSSGQLTV